MGEETKDPTPDLRVLHVSLAGRKVVKVKPAGDKLTIGDKTWTLDHSCLAPGDGKWDVMVIEGKGQAVSFNADHDNPSPEEWDQACNNNLLKQIHDLSQPVKTPAISWIMMITLGIVVLAVIGAGIKNANDEKATKAEILHLEDQLAQAMGTQQQQGSGQVQYPQAGGG